MELYKDFCKNYPVITIEDPFDQDDWDNTTAFTAEGVSQVKLRDCMHFHCSLVTSSHVFSIDTSDKTLANNRSAEQVQKNSVYFAFPEVVIWPAVGCWG